MASFLRLHPTDNVVVAVNGLSPGDIVDDVKITRRIPPGHKAAVRPIAKDQPALKFGQIIGFADADNKVPIDEFDKFLPLLRANADAAIGSRAIDSTKIEKPQPIYRQIGSRGFYFFVQTVVGLPGITDSQCGFKFFRHALAKAIFAKQEIDGYMYDVEILALAIRMGAKLEQVPVRWRDDADSRLDLVAGNIQNVKDIFRIRRRLAAIRPEEYATARQAVANQK